MMTLLKNIALAVVLGPVVALQAAAQADSGSLKQDMANGVPGGADLVAGTAQFQDGMLTISFTVASGTPVEWQHIYLNTDNSGQTGFIHAVNPVAGKGMDFLIEPDFLYHWNGADDQSGWHWEKLQPVEHDTNGQTVTYQIPIAPLGLKPDSKISIMIETATDSYKATLDTLPRGSVTWQVTVPANLTVNDATGAAMGPVATPDPNARARFRKIQSYACYYGPGPGHTEDLSRRDAVIVETRNLTPGDVAAIKKSGTLVTGYISAGEDDKLRVGDGKGPGGYDSCYLDRVHKGVPDKNGEWNSYYVNPESPSWKAYFLATAQKMVQKYGVDGFFLDTIETATVYPDLQPGMVSLIKDLRAAHPQSIIILNRGFPVIAQTSSVIDGFMFEDFSAGHYFDDRGYVFNDASSLDGTHEQAKSLEPYMAKDGLVVLALDYAATAQRPYLKDAYDRARTFGFIPYASTVSLGTIFDEPYAGTPNPKWKTELSNPEALSVVLAKDTNGFPKGTRVLPSSTYADYSVGTVMTQVADRRNLDWQNEAWASQERETQHYLEFRFPNPIEPSRLVVDWATDHGQAFPSRAFSVEVKPAGGGKDAGWKQVWATDDNLHKHCEIEWPPEKISSLRIVQPAASGSTARPNLMWVEQVQLH